MDSYTKFKNECIVNSISTFLITGAPIPKLWIFPEFIKNNKSLLGNFLDTAYKYYNDLSDDDKVVAIKWFETHGEYTASLIDALCYEDCEYDTLPTFNLNILKDKNPEIYKEVVTKVANKVYSHFGKDAIQIIINKFVDFPDVFTEEISRNS
jgi:hypothetical protein